MSWLLPGLVEINLAAGGAILFVLLVRRGMARHFGPHAAYALWAIVPVAMAATLLPERTLFALETDFLFGEMPAAVAVSDDGAGFAWLPSLLSWCGWVERLPSPRCSCAGSGPSCARLISGWRGRQSWAFAIRAS